MKTGKAFLAGVVGAVAMSLIMAMARAMGMEVNLEMMLGTMFGASPGPGTWLFGLMMHLVISGLIALLYALGFEYVAHRAGWKIGLAFSLIHIAIGGIVMGMMPMMHPLVPEQLSAPGAFMINHGMLGLGAFIMLHMIFGAIVGGMYGRVIHPAPDIPHHGPVRHA
jgi:hypothetical protein